MTVRRRAVLHGTAAGMTLMAGDARAHVAERPAKGQGTFKDYDLGFIHINIKHLPKLQMVDSERRKRTLFGAIDRCSRSVHLIVKGDEIEKSAITFLREAAAAFPFRFTHVLTDNGSYFTPAFANLRRAGSAVSPHQASDAADLCHGRMLQQPHQQRGAQH